MPGDDPIPQRTGLARALHVIAREIRHAIPPTLFFAIGFNLILLTQRLVLSQYLGQFVGFMVATTAALVVGKAVLVADALPFLNRFENHPLIRPILFKTIVYWAVVFVARLLEGYIRYVADQAQFGGYLAWLDDNFSWRRFLFVQIWILVLFLIYTTASELNALFGHGELYRILFSRRPSDLQLTRRERVRALVRLGRIIERHTPAELRDPAKPPYQEVVRLIEQLARDTARSGGEEGRGRVEGAASAAGTTR